MWKLWGAFSGLLKKTSTILEASRILTCEAVLLSCVRMTKALKLGVSQGILGGSHSPVYLRCSETAMCVWL